MEPAFSEANNVKSLEKTIIAQAISKTNCKTKQTKNINPSSSAYAPNDKQIIIFCTTIVLNKCPQHIMYCIQMLIEPKPF